MNTVDVLVAGRKLIADGWVQGEYISASQRKPKFCSLGSINRVLGETDDAAFNSMSGDRGLRTRVVRYLSHAAAQEGLADRGHNSLHLAQYSIIKVNDEPTRTKMAILSWFDRAIRNARRRHVNG